jgi:hypothetical protein
MGLLALLGRLQRRIKQIKNKKIKTKTKDIKYMLEKVNKSKRSAEQYFWIRY